MAHVRTKYMVYDHSGSGVRHHHFTSSNNISNPSDDNFPGSTDMSPGSHTVDGWPTLNFKGNNLPFAFMSVKGTADGNKLFTSPGNRNIQVGSSDVDVLIVYAPNGGFGGPNGEPGIWVDAFNVDTGNFSDDLQFIKILTPPTPPDVLDNVKTAEANNNGDISSLTTEHIRASASIDGGVPFVEWKKIYPTETISSSPDFTLDKSETNEIWIAFYQTPANRIIHIPNEAIWQWVDYATMVDDGVHPWNPDFRYLLTGIVLADLAKYSSPALTKEYLSVAAKQIALSARGIVSEINLLADKLKDKGV